MNMVLKNVLFACERVGKLEPLCLWVGMENGAAAADNSMAVLQTITNRLTVWCGNLVIYPKELKAGLKERAYIHVHISIVHSGQNGSNPTVH